MNKVYKACFILLLTMVALKGSGQTIRPSVLNVTGGTSGDPNSYYRFDWSIGEMTMIETLTPANGMFMLTHGILQPLSELVGNSNLSLIFAPGEFRLFPNPTVGRFELDFFVRESGFIRLQLSDANGKVMEVREREYSNASRIAYFDLTRYPSGTYFVIATLYPSRLRVDNKSVIRHSSFRVVKIDNR